MDLLSQIRAVTGAMRKIESGILTSHLQHCVNDAITSKSQKEATVKIKEITRLFEKLN
jgi:DNA-binding FrmR family transcriptional regulator